MSQTASPSLPRWNLAQYFSAPTSPEFEASFARLARTIASAETLFAECGVSANDTRPTAPETVGFIDRTLLLLDQALRETRLLRSYTSCCVAADSKDVSALERQSALATPVAALMRLQSRFAAWIATRDLDAAFSVSNVCRDHRYFLSRLKQNADKLLSPAEEDLLADLYDSTVGAWGRLYARYTSQLTVSLRGGDRSMSQIRALAYDADPDVRRDAYQAELGAWGANSLVVSSGLNSIKAHVATVSKRRGWPSVLDEAVDASNIERRTLDCMMEAVQESFPVFRRYLKAKARILGRSNGLPWYDLFAPVGTPREWTYGQATAFVEDKFSQFGQKLADLARSASVEGRVDAEPRPGKVDGAFCSGIRDGESLVLMNFKPSFGSVSTLAHELGHAYHNLCLAGRTELQRAIPMTLAETASIFCETIVKKAALKECGPDERLALLEASLQGQCQIVVDIASRFLFENDVFERRAESELSPDELCRAMSKAQKATYGDGLDPDLRHPYVWSAKPHYYSSRSFYNFPYTFGLLFALGLYDLYEREPQGFQDRYDLLLSQTGLSSAEDLSRGFGIDIGDVAFWRGSLSQIGQDVETFESLAS